MQVIKIVFEVYLTAVLMFATLMPILSKLKIFRNKRDPFFWRRTIFIGSPIWATKWVIWFLTFAIILSNIVTPIVYQFYEDLFGIGVGGIGSQMDSLERVLEPYKDPSQWWGIINPYQWQEKMNVFPFLWMCVFSITGVMGVMLMWRRYANTHDDSTIEMGGAEFTEPNEVKKQYHAVPDRGLKFAGYGGVPVMHSYKRNCEGFKMLLATVRPQSMPVIFYKYKAQDNEKDNDKTIPGYYYVDFKPVNTIVVGDTRSGKGETVVLSTIDLVARGEEDQTLVVGDLKGELFTKTNEHLRRNNYDIRVLNFDNLNYSMSLNLLDQALFQAKKGNWTKTRQKISQLTNAIFPGDDTNFENRYWTSGSSATFAGLVLSSIWILRQEDPDMKKVTIANAVEMLQQLSTQHVFMDTGTNMIVSKPKPGGQTRPMNRLDYLVKIMQTKLAETKAENKADPLLEMAIASFNQAGMGSDDSKGNIYSSMFSDVEMFVSDMAVRKMTSVSDFRYSSAGFPRIMQLQLPMWFANRKARIEFDAKGKHYDEMVILDEIGLIQFAIAPKLDEYTTFKLSFDIPDNIETSEQLVDGHTPIVEATMELLVKKEYVYQGMKRKIDPYTGLPVIKGIKMVNDRSEASKGVWLDDILPDDALEFDYTEKRLAIFIVLPPLAAQYYQLGLFFMEQLYQENFDWANRNKKKNINRIHYLIDEFGNFPKWAGLETKLSAALGYNFQFTLILQNLEQLANTYGEESKGTIMANSSNFLYIKSGSLSTTKELSEKLGDRTITYRNPNSDEKSKDIKSGNTISRALLNPQELATFRPSQMLVWRNAQNESLKGSQVDTNPIYDFGRTSMPFAFNLYRNYYSDSAELSRVEVDSPHRFIDMRKFDIDWNVKFEQLYDQVILKKDVQNNSVEETSHEQLNEISYIPNASIISSKEFKKLSEQKQKALLYEIDGLLNDARTGKFIDAKPIPQGWEVEITGIHQHLSNPDNWDNELQKEWVRRLGKDGFRALMVAINTFKNS